MWSKAFWKSAFERVIRSTAYAIFGGITIGAGFGDIDWIRLLSVAGVVGVSSLLVSLGVNKVSGGEGPAINKNEVVVDTEAFDKQEQDVIVAEDVEGAGAP
jgi:hypothetical protein